MSALKSRENSWSSARLNDSKPRPRSEEHTSELQSQSNLVCRLLLEKKKMPRWAWTRPPTLGAAQTTAAPALEERTVTTRIGRHSAPCDIRFPPDDAVAPRSVPGGPC